MREGSNSTPSTQRHESPKRKPSDITDADTSGKRKRRKVNHACVYCRRSHMTCDLERPCTRCVKRDIGHLCHDEPRDGPKRSKSEGGGADLPPAGEEGLQQQEVGGGDGATQTNGKGKEVQYLAQANGAVNDGSLNGTVNPTATAAPQGELFLPIHSEEPFVVHDKAFPLQKDVEAAIAKPPTFGRHRIMRSRKMPSSPRLEA